MTLTDNTNRTAADLGKAMARIDAFGGRVSAALTHGTDNLPHDFTERLRVARLQALAKRKRELNFYTAPSMVSVGGGALALNGGPANQGDDRMGWLGRIGTVLPLIALVVGLIAIENIQSQSRASELAEVDSALLTDDLPPAAYADPGFAQFIKNTR